MIESITVYDRVRLRELGIDACYDLASIDYLPCLFKTPCSPRVPINWILQSRLCVYFGEHLRDTLAPVENLVSNDPEIERLVAAQLKLSKYWSTSEDDEQSSEASAPLV